MVCREPIEVVSYKIGVCKVSPNGKDCHTEFERLSFNGRTSVVLCRPLTGRMHQIRVHLQYLGKSWKEGGKKDILFLAFRPALLQERSHFFGGAGIFLHFFYSGRSRTSSMGGSYRMDRSASDASD